MAPRQSVYVEVSMTYGSALPNSVCTHTSAADDQPPQFNQADVILFIVLVVEEIGIMLVNTTGRQPHETLSHTQCRH
eukprot:2335383-Amphidinium_carterae.2